MLNKLGMFMPPIEGGTYEISESGGEFMWEEMVWEPFEKGDKIIITSSSVFTVKFKFTWDSEEIFSTGWQTMPSYQKVNLSASDELRGEVSTDVVDKL